MSKLDALQNLAEALDDMDPEDNDLAFYLEQDDQLTRQFSQECAA